MKKLNELGLNPKNILKNDELLNLRGGINCICQKNNTTVICGSANNAEECTEMCSAYNGATGTFLP